MHDACCKQTLTQKLKVIQFVYSLTRVYILVLLLCEYFYTVLLIYSTLFSGSTFASAFKRVSSLSICSQIDIAVALKSYPLQFSYMPVCSFCYLSYACLAKCWYF